MILVIFISSISCSNGSCDLDGCDRKGEGWTNSSDCGALYPCRLSESGGYCSRSHAFKDL